MLCYLFWASFFLSSNETVWTSVSPRVLQAPSALGAKIVTLDQGLVGSLMPCGAVMVTNNRPCIVSSLILVGSFVALTLDLFLPIYTGQMACDPNKMTSGLRARRGSLG